MILFADGWDVGWSLPIISLLFTIKCWLTCDVLPSLSFIILLLFFPFFLFLCDILPVVGGNSFFSLIDIMVIYYGGSIIMVDT